MDDFRLAPILDEASIFEQHGQDLLSLDLPPILNQSIENSHEAPTTPTRARENPFPETQSFDLSPSSARKQQQDGSNNQSTLPIARVLNQEQGEIPRFRDYAQDISQGLYGSLQLPQPNVQYASDNLIPRIPPLLQGLHDPPPDAGLFPRITDEEGCKIAHPPLSFSNKVSVKSPQSLRDLRLGPLKIPEGTHQETSHLLQPSHSSEKIDQNLPGAKRKEHIPRKNHKWSKEETLDLLKGVTVHGVGKWKDILHDETLNFNSRSHIDLKDRYRVCSEKKRGEKRKHRLSHQSAFEAHRPCEMKQPEVEHVSQRAKKGGRGDSASKPKVEELADLGISRPSKHNQNSTRRQRHAFTAAEDAAILSGYEKYPAQWTRIMDHPDLMEANRSRGDVRDRWRVLCKRGKASLVQIITSERKREEPASRGPMNLGHIIDTGGTQGTSRSEMPAPANFDHTLGFINPAITWKPTNILV